MYKEIKTTREFLRDLFNVIDFDYKYYWMEAIEIYLKDMGVALYRTSNWITEYFGLYRPARFKGLHEERRLKAETGIAPSHWYFSFGYTICLILLLIFLFIIFSLNYFIVISKQYGNLLIKIKKK